MPLSQEVQPKPARSRYRLAMTVGAALLATILQGCDTQAEKDSKAYQARYAKAKAVFVERCKTAGVVIYRTVQDVEGIELTKLRPQLEWADKRYFDPMFDGAAMAGEHKGVDYINQFLMTELIDPRYPDRRGRLNPPDFEASSGFPRRRGYRFVEFFEPGTRQRMRGELGIHPPGTNLWGRSPRVTQVTVAATRYAVDFEDIVDPSDRQQWIAGTRLKVIDKQTGEVMATMTKYVWDPGFGVSTTGRWPWQHANSAASRRCPSDATQLLHNDSRYFTDTVLIPRQGV